MAVAYAYLYPNANSSVGADVSVSPSGTAWEAVNDPYSEVNDDDLIISSATDDTGSGTANFTFQDMPQAISVSKVSLRCRLRRHASMPPGTGTGQDHKARLHLKISGTEYSATAIIAPPSVNWTWYGFEWANPPSAPTTEWTKALVDGLIAGAAMWEDGTNSITGTGMSACYLLVEYVAAPSQIEQARLVGSQKLWLTRKASPSSELVLPIGYADTGVGDDLEVSHPDGPHPTDEGWLYELWQRRRMRVLERTIDLDGGNVRFKLLDLRATAYMASLVETLRTDIAPGAIDDGLLRLQSGGGRAFTRSTDAWAQAPEDGRVTLRVANELMLQGPEEHRAAALEPARTNFAKQSSFTGGAASWTASTAGATIVATNDLFDSGVTEWHGQIVSDAASDVYLETFCDVPEPGGNEVLRLSIDYELSSATTLYWQLERIADSRQWDPVNGDWGGSGFYTLADMMVTGEPTGRGSILRCVSEAILHEPTATNGYYLRIGVTAAEASGATLAVYHAQLEGYDGDATVDSATSRIVTTTARVTREVDYLSFGETLDNRAWPIDGGTVLFEYRPNWCGVDGSVGLGPGGGPFSLKNLLRVQYEGDGSYMDACFCDTWNGSVGVTFRRRIASVNYDATHGTILDRKDCNAAGVMSWYRIALRMVGEDGELDLTPWTLSIFVDGVKGTDVVSAKMTDVPSSATLYLGGSPSGVSGDGQFRNVVMLPFCLTDAEIAAWRL